ncbi:MAG: mannitol-/sugar-/sorbitol-6-phosphatase [Pseudonocardiales bacterium]|nr:mannitol-/sugar-/sorbitol-6-phosphatase [Pseudonocardiales bacterium]
MRGSLPASALLLDMDGVLVDSTGSVEEHWGRWADRRGLERAAVLRFAHGTPTRDVVARFVAPDEIATEAAWVEGLALEPAAEHALPGAAALLSQRVLPVAVVTSATRVVADLRLRRAGLPAPRVLVSADDVQRGKPDPEPYRRAAELLGIAPVDCVGVEDTPPGVAALRAAGVTAVALLTTYPSSALGDADLILPDLAALHPTDSGVEWET